MLISRHAPKPHSEIEAALAQPEVALRRTTGSTDPFMLNPRLPTASDLPDKPTRERTGKATSTSKPRASLKPQPAPSPDRTALNAAEAALAALDHDRREEERAFREQRATLDAEARTLEQRRRDLEAKQAAARTRFEAMRSKVVTAAERERSADAKAGGT